MKIKAFTLAEVLVTLTIIGVVSTMTIPTLMNKNKEVQTVAAVKNTYAILQDAFKQAEIDNGSIDSWDLTTSSTQGEGSKLFDYLLPYLKILKNCQNNDKECIADEYYTLNKSKKSAGNDNKVYNAILKNGTSLIFWNTEGKGIIAIDINGRQKPNRRGVDYFTFVINQEKNKIVPAGSKSLEEEFGFEEYTLGQSCVFGNDSYEHNGKGCTAWVIYKGNMDYLKRQVSWDE